jgi:membrane peptidoglycan carboxypeptidase
VLAGVVAAHGQVAGHDAAAKTGTQQYGDGRDNQDAWTAGYTQGLAAVTWVGREKPGAIREADGTPIDGSGMPYRMWQTFLGAALASTPAVPLPAPAHLGKDLGDAKDGSASSRVPAPTGPARGKPSPSRSQTRQPGAGGGSPSGSAPAGGDDRSDQQGKPAPPIDDKSTDPSGSPGQR